MDTTLGDDHATVLRREHRDWTASALQRLHAEKMRGAETPLIPLPLSAIDGIGVYLKDESSHPTGSLKHRLARSLFIQALCDGDLGPRTPVFEASSGSTAVSEAYFARLIGIPFIAVVPRSTSREKIALIERYGGRCHLIDDAARVAEEAERLATESGGYFMNQFARAAEATNWRSDNIADELFEQMRYEPHPEPRWVVVGAGTGGTSTCFARHARYRGVSTRIAVVDPEGSAFYEGWRRGDSSVTTSTASRIEGIGRPRVEPSFLPGLVDEMIRVPDAASIAAMRWCSRHLGRAVGGSTGTNVWGTLLLTQRMAQDSTAGSLVTLICDAGDRYASTYYNDDWLAEAGIDIRPYSDALLRFEEHGTLTSPVLHAS